MPFTYTFQNGVLMTGWDEALLRNRAASVRQAAYQARWGESACPPQNTACPEEKLRRLCWALKKSDGEPRVGAGPKCYSCRVNRAEMPKGPHVPNGSDAEDVLPCGCQWKYVAVELICEFNYQLLFGGVFPDPDKKLPKTLDRGHRQVMWEFFQLQHGCHGGYIPGRPVMQVIDLVRAANRVAALNAGIGSGVLQ